MKKLITTSTTLHRMTERNKYSLLTTTAIVFIFTSSFVNGDYEQCQTSLRNIVVYEGTLDTLLDCTIGPNGTAWSVRSISNSSVTHDIIDFDDTVDGTYAGLYAINQTGLIIRNATTTSGAGGPIPTAGTYTVFFNASDPTNQTIFKLVVIRSGPNCSCNQSIPDRVSISCTIVYADHPTYVINPIMSCTANGQVYNATTPMRTRIPSNPIQYVYSSTPILVVNNTGLSTFDCLVTFSSPAFGSTSLAKNAPDFSETRQVSCGTTASPTTTTQDRSTTTTPSTTNTMSQMTTTRLVSFTTPSTATFEQLTNTQSSATLAQQQTTISLPLATTSLTTVAQQTVPTQQILAGKEIVLSVEVLLAVVLGCILLTAAVCCCWCCLFFPGCCQSRFRRQPIYVLETNEIGIAEENGFWGRRYIPRYTDGCLRHNQLGYRNKFIL